MSLKAPILFIHYGPETYLRRTLRCARITNPDKRIILLGDGTNKQYARGRADFVDLRQVATGGKVADFDRVFQVIQGERHRFTKLGGIETWLKFVFRRWFLIEQFLANERIDSFWTFDSDTLVLAPLAGAEHRYADVAATTQCRGECLNGWIGSADLVARYTSCILDLFRDETFLDAQRERLRPHAGLAFNEMDAFCEFRRREGIPLRRASEVIAGEAFDDALAFVDDYEPAPVAVLGKTAVKRLWTSTQGGIWARTGGTYARLLTCNMSWMPDFVWKKILRCAQARKPDGARDLCELDFAEPFVDALGRKACEFAFVVRRWFQNFLRG